MIREKDVMVSEPTSIFVHSLFRAGSTYIFNVFRRSETGYWCYQEPLHELAYWARGDKERLLEIDRATATVLRHPRLERPYFFELHEVADKCLPLLKKELIYDAYFPDGCEDFGQTFFGSLIEAARGTAVIQECRTSMRIGALKRELGGLHVYLWRNPWDQWWSYKVDNYFDIKSQLFINGQSVPEIVRRLRQEVGFSGFDGDDLQQQFSWFGVRRLSPEKNYLAFYTLWLLGLQHGVENADVLVNIDRLSDDVDYRKMIADELESKGVGGLDFSDCEVPQACYGNKDKAFYERIEDRAHGLFLLSGTSQEELSRLLALRHASVPQVWRGGGQYGTASSLIRDAERARALVRQVEQREVELVADLARQAWNAAQQVATAENTARGESDRAARAEHSLRCADEYAQREHSRAVDLEQQVDVLSDRAMAAEAEAAAQEYRAGLAQAFIEDLELRVIEAETRVVGLEARSAEVGVVCEASQRTPVSEVQLDELKRRVVAALMQMKDLEQRAIAAETRVGQLEFQIFEAEGRATESEIRAAAAETRQAEFESRSALAEAHAQGLQTRVAESEARVEELERRAAAAIKLERRAVAAEAEVVAQEERAVSAEGRAEELQRRLSAVENLRTEFERRAAVAESSAAEMGCMFASLEKQWQFELSQVRALHAERDELHSALAAAQGSSHYWRLASDQWHERILALHRSNSWRMTAPVRAVKRVISGDVSPLRQAVGVMKRQVRRVLRPSAVLVVRAALNRPAFRYRVGRTLQKYPVLRSHVVLFARNAGLLPPAGPRLPNPLQQSGPSSDADGSTGATSAEDSELSSLSVTGRQIYAELKRAVQQNRNRAN